MKVTLRAVEEATGKAMTKVNYGVAQVVKKFTMNMTPKDVAARTKDTFKDITDIMRNQIAHAYQESYYRECYEVQNQIGSYFKVRKLSIGEIRAFVSGTLAGKNWEVRLKRWYREYINQVGVISSFVPDADREKFIQMVTGKNGDSGLTYKIMRIMRTESANASNRGMISAYKQLGIKRYKVISILDDRLCKFCHEERNEKIYYVRLAKKGDTIPPFHPNCRCYIVPMISRDVGRALKKKGTKGKMTYAEWRKKFV